QLLAAMQQESRTNKAKPNQSNPVGPADKRADAELHVIGAAVENGGKMTRMDVEVRPTAKPVVLVLTSYDPVDWHVKLAEGARPGRALVGGYFAQEFQGLPADVPIVNQSWSPSDGSRRKNGWFYPDRWNTPRWRAMVRRLNDLTGLPVATFQEDSRTVSF